MTKHELRKLRKTAGMTTVKRWEPGTCGMRSTSERLIRQIVARDFSLARAADKLSRARKRPR